MELRGLVRFAVSVMLLGLVPAVGSEAQEWEWPEKPENLQKLPKDWSGQRLRPVMIGFTRALGVECSHCHVGKEGEPLSTYDFASDENPNKNRARVMLDLLGIVNEKLKEIEPSGENRVNMWCHTCHRGRPRPMTLDEELHEVYRRSGVAAAIERYRSLEEEFYGKGSYSFTVSSLESLARGILRGEDSDGAIEILRFGTTEFPESSRIWASLGEVYSLAGQTEKAKLSLEKALQLDGENERAQRMLDELNQGE